MSLCTFSINPEKPFCRYEVTGTLPTPTPAHAPRLPSPDLLKKHHPISFGTGSTSEAQLEPPEELVTKDDLIFFCFSVSISP